MKKITLLFCAGLALLTIKTQAQTVTDIDGNVYNTVQIGGQVWLKENLKVTRFQNGDAIPNVTDDNQWGITSMPAYCDYNNTPAYSVTYGKLYNWYTAKDTRNVCPSGWHIPSYSESNKLEKYLDNTVDTNTTGFLGTDVGGKLKEAGYSHWSSPNIGATNSSGFTALPGGYRHQDGTYKFLGVYGFWYNSTEVVQGYSFAHRLSYDENRIYTGTGNKNVGVALRCIKNINVGINEINDNIEIGIYPNPAFDKLTVTNIEQEGITLGIYNMLGECVLQTLLSKGENTVDITSLSKGIYVVKASGAAFSVHRKMIKE